MQRYDRKRGHFSRITAIVFMLVILMGVSGCALSSPFTQALTSTEETESEIDTFSDYQTISGVVIALDTGEKTMSVFNVSNQETKEFTYSGGTNVRNKYGDGISMTQVRVGEIVDIEYEKVNGRIKELHISSEAWELSNITSFSMDRTNKTIQAGSGLYRYNSNIAIVSEGQLVEPTEISDQDELTIKGYGTTAYSIIITKGHGYVSLENEEAFFGGILTIGKIAKKITSNMIVIVPEGEYTLEIVSGNLKGTFPIRVTRNEELTVDVKSFVGDAKKVGTVQFQVQPETAVLYLNGKKTSYKEVATLDYGTYTIRVEADDYVTFIEKYTVFSSYQEKKIVLESNIPESSAETSVESETETSSTIETTKTLETSSTTEMITKATETSSIVETTKALETQSTEQTTVSDVPSTTETQTTSNKGSGEQGSPSASVSATTSGAPSSISSGDVSEYKIHITEPTKTEVYFDGDYVGTAPVSLTKVSGEHTILFKKDGYVTKAYTVNISSDQIDSYYSFPELAKNQ